LEWLRLALIREATISWKNRVTTLAYWLGTFYTPPPGKERPSSRQKDPIGLKAPEEEPEGRQRESAKAKALVVVPAERVRDPTNGKWPEVVKPKKKPVELWEIGMSGASPKPMPEEEPIVDKPRRRRLRRPASRGDDAGTISVVQFPAQRPPTRTTIHLVPMEGQGRPPADLQPPPEKVVTMAKDLPTMMAVEITDVPAEEEALPAEELLTAQEPTAEPAAAIEIQIPTWNLGERIPIAPQF
jgi:hypothetical protein